MSTRKNLKAIAKEIFARCLAEGWEPTTREMQEQFALSEQQMSKVKQYTKKVAADRGLGWGYDEYFDRFRVVPSNDKKAAKRVTDYALKSTAAQGKGAGHILRGVYGQGYLTENSYREGASDLKEAREQIGSISAKLVYVEA